MKNIKINTEILVFLLILSVMPSSLSSFGLCTEYNYINNNIEKNYSSSVSSLRVKSQCKLTNFSIVSDEPDNTHNPTISSYDDINNVVIADSQASESYPSMVIKGIDGLIAYEYQVEEKPFIYIRNTKNFGQSWSNPYKLKVYIESIDTSVNSPSISINQKNGYVYGAFLTDYNNSGVHGIFNVQDISGNLNNIQVTLWDWSNVYSGGFYLGSWWGFKDITIKYHNNNYAPWITCFIASTNYSNETGVGPCKNAVMYGYLGPGSSGSMWIQWEPKYGNCNNLSVAMSEDSKKIYGVSEKMNKSNTDLLYFTGSYKTGAEGPYLDLDYYNFTGPENLYHPNIFVKNDVIYIVVENNLHEIVLYMSDDNGNTWRLYNVTSEILPSNSNPKYPQLYVDTTSIFCTFIESGNISIISSSVNKINWTTPNQLNNVNKTVVSKYRFSDMFDMNHIVWTDTRNGNNDLYSFISNIPEFDLKVKDVYITNMDYPFLQTKNMINFTIVNLGEFPVSDVEIEVLYSCINKELVETGYPGFIAFLDSGMEKSFNQYLFRINLKEFFQALISFSGIQNITIIVDPYNKYEDKNVYDNSITIPVSYKEIFPLLSFLE